jgi:hypothetical protein
MPVLMAKSYNILAQSHLGLGTFTEALECAERARVLAKKAEFAELYRQACTTAGMASLDLDHLRPAYRYLLEAVRTVRRLVGGCRKAHRASLLARREVDNLLDAFVRVAATVGKAESAESLVNTLRSSVATSEEALPADEEFGLEGMNGKSGQAAP